MAHTFLDEVSQVNQHLLLQIARDAIAHGLHYHKPLHVDTDQFSPELAQAKACFVTLYMDDDLRGCIGTLTPQQSLIEAVADNAYKAAFNDIRFPPLKEEEFGNLVISISVLGIPEKLECNDEPELLTKIRPGVDGLIFEDQGLKGTFLPSVWKSLPDPKEFLHHLKSKAGYHPDHWSSTVKVFRYETQSFSE